MGASVAQSVAGPELADDLSAELKKEREQMTNSEKWPLLLRGIGEMNVKTTKYTPTSCGHAPDTRPIDIHLKYGVINLDKPCNPSSHEVVSWIKNILRCSKTGHSGTLDPAVSGCLPVCLNRATRIAKAQQDVGKEYVAVVKFEADVDEEQFKEALVRFQGPLLQRPPLQCAVKRDLRIRKVESNTFLDFDPERRLGMFHTACEAGTYIRSLCVHIGLSLGVKSHMAELRRVRSGSVDETALVTMHDVLDAMYLYDRSRDESYLRKVVLPLETLLTGYPRVIVKDSSVDAVCHGGQLTIPGVLRYDDFGSGDMIVLVTPKGEAVALCKAVMSASEISVVDHGEVCKIKRVIMEKDTYRRQWKLGGGSIPVRDEESKAAVVRDEEEPQKRKEEVEHRKVRKVGK
jgi:H/ACA ribonucleoprotein complex subunit 4